VRVKTDSTHPPKGLFTRKASTIAKALASNKVSPRGPRMLTYFINRGGKGLTASRRAELGKGEISAGQAHGVEACGVPLCCNSSQAWSSPKISLKARRTIATRLRRGGALGGTDSSVCATSEGPEGSARPGLQWCEAGKHPAKNTATQGDYRETCIDRTARIV
jgi:hypothetical protein